MRLERLKRGSGEHMSKSVRLKRDSKVGAKRKSGGGLEVLVHVRPQGCLAKVALVELVVDGQDRVGQAIINEHRALRFLRLQDFTPGNHKGSCRENISVA